QHILAIAETNKEYEAIALGCLELTLADNQLDMLVDVIAKYPKLLQEFPEFSAKIIRRAIIENDIDLLKTILKKTGDNCINLKIDAIHPLSMAVKQNNTEAVALLIKHGANVDGLFAGEKYT